jgi:hypothetical protein
VTGSRDGRGRFRPWCPKCDAHSAPASLHCDYCGLYLYWLRPADHLLRLAELERRHYTGDELEEAAA